MCPTDVKENVQKEIKVISHKKSQRKGVKYLTITYQLKNVRADFRENETITAEDKGGVYKTMAVFLGFWH